MANYTKLKEFQRKHGWLLDRVPKIPRNGLKSFEKCKKPRIFDKMWPWKLPDLGGVWRGFLAKIITKKLRSCWAVASQQIFKTGDENFCIFSKELWPRGEMQLLRKSMVMVTAAPSWRWYSYPLHGSTSWTSGLWTCPPFLSPWAWTCDTWRTWSTGRWR